MNFLSLFACKRKKKNKKKDKKKNDPPKPNKNLINYRLNDPTTPELVIQMPVPLSPQAMPFEVAGFVGNNLGELGTKQNQAANVYATIANSLNYTLECRKLKNWARTHRLKIDPRAGNKLNAYYDGRALKFFYTLDRQAKKIVYTADSVDIVAHELGHAVLDTMRPDFWSSQGLEVWGFHEAFADISAVVTVMLHDEMIEYALKKTDGNLRKSNAISKLAEEVGGVIYGMTGGKGGFKPGEMRNAINDFKYTPPERLPYDTSHDKLGGECHSFGRLMLGAWYEIFVEIYELEKKTTPSFLDAAIKARNVAYNYMVKAVKMAPNSVRLYNGVARAMLGVDRVEGGTYKHLIYKVFKRRRMLAKQITHLFNPLNLEALEAILSDSSDIEESEHGKLITSHRTASMRLSDHLGIGSLAHNPLYDVEVEVPADVFYDFNPQGKILNYLQSTNKEMIYATAHCLDIIHYQGLVGDHDDALFEIVGNKLIRKKVV
jgi:hypothetical protein